VSIVIKLTSRVVLNLPLIRDLHTTNGSGD
jgi:hypothetical protein